MPPLPAIHAYDALPSITRCTFSRQHFNRTGGSDATHQRRRTIEGRYKGVTAKIPYETPVSGGDLPKLKGKYTLRVTKIAIAPGGYVGDQNHLGPGIRQMTLGEMEYVMPDRTLTYRAGDYFFEAGDMSHRVHNTSGEICKHLLFEILPVDLAGASLIHPRDKHP